MASVFFESSSELARLTNTFAVGGTATDPTTVSLIVTTPSQVETTYTYAASEITKSAVGVYYKDIACSEDGTWSYQWVGTGSATDSEAGTWEVLPTALGRLYATVEALKSRMQISTSTHDFEVHEACFAASRGVEQYCERTFYQVTETRTFVPRDYYDVLLPEWNDLVSVTTLKTDASGDGTFETTWASTDYQLLPHNRSGPETKPFTAIKALARTFPLPTTRLARDDRVEIAGVWGWPSVPQAVKQATLILAHELYVLKDAPFGVADFGEMGLVRARARENPKVATLLGPYRRNAFLVA